jgi:putative heme degradation protein
MTTLRFVAYRFFQGVSQRVRAFKQTITGPESVYTKPSQDSPLYQRYVQKQKSLDQKKMEQLERQRALTAEQAEIEAAKKRQLAAWKKDVERSFTKR